jgi:hypothetical protein
MNAHVSCETTMWFADDLVFYDRMWDINWRFAPNFCLRSAYVGVRLNLRYKVVLMACKQFFTAYMGTYKSRCGGLFSYNSEYGNRMHRAPFRKIRKSYQYACSLLCSIGPYIAVCTVDYSTFWLAISKNYVIRNSVRKFSIYTQSSLPGELL